MSWGAEGIPRDVEPAGGGKELVGIFKEKAGRFSLIHFNKAVKH